jgi:high-affinity nickel-transport protein
MLDTIDGALMMTLYTSTSLARDTVAILYYSIVLSAITVLVAMVIGMIQLLSVIANFSSGPFWDGVDAVGDHYSEIGGAICGAFVVFGGLSVILYKPWRRRVDRRYAARFSFEAEDNAIQDEDNGIPKKISREEERPAKKTVVAISTEVSGSRSCFAADRRISPIPT